MGQGVLVVTEPHSELNAGLIVVFRSSHPSLFDWNAWTLRFRGSPGTIPDVEYGEEASKLAVAFWGRIGEFLMRSRIGSELSDEEKALWIQSGLAVSPLMGTCLQYSLDFCLAWALIGEWTSRVLFPVPKGQWPRHGHAGALLTPRIVASARAAFEQGALPSLLLMPGIAPVFSLPGDRMFQATEVVPGFQRPAIMHAYGGAKTGMERALASIAPEGWLPMAAAMLGTVGKPPMWAQHWGTGTETWQDPTSLSGGLSMRIAVLSCSKVFLIGRALSTHVRKANLELVKLAMARLPHTQLIRLIVKKMENMSCRWGEKQLRWASNCP